MNDQNDVETLLMLDALGETTPEQELRLREALAGNPELAARHAALTKETQQMESLLQTKTSRAASEGEAPPLPAHVLARLESARREALANRRGQAEAMAKVIAFPSAGTRQQTERRNMLRVWLARAAVIALLGAITGYWFLSEKHPPVASAAIAPRGASGLTQPLIVWENKPDQAYDVWILPPDGSQTEAPALFTAKNVRAPLAFTDLKPTEVAHGDKELQPGKKYRLLVCFATLGRLAGVTVPFETSADAGGQLHVPSDFAAVLLKAKRLVESGKPGDALMVLSTLPENQRTTLEARALEDEAKKKLPEADKVPRG